MDAASAGSGEEGWRGREAGTLGQDLGVPTSSAVTLGSACASRHNCCCLLGTARCHWTTFCLPAQKLQPTSLTSPSATGPPEARSCPGPLKAPRLPQSEVYQGGEGICVLAPLLAVSPLIPEKQRGTGQPLSWGRGCPSGWHQSYRKVQLPPCTTDQRASVLSAGLPHSPC